MRQLEATNTRPYKVVLGSDFESLKDTILEANKPSAIMIITDTNVGPLYLEEIRHKLEGICPIYSYSFTAGEGSKHLGTVTEIYNTLIEKQMDRSGLIVALGGGVVGDIAGFVASSYMRGIPFIQIPTTVVAQNDSSIGGKVGVDYAEHKNMVGAFYQPLLVYTNIQTLKTLPKREFTSGLAEVLKHALIKNRDFYDYLVEKKDKILQQDEKILLDMTYLSCQVKCQVVEEDTKELGIRKILNFGHTIGHALETESQFSILHGECVAYGMVMSAYISFKKDMITKEVLHEVEALCRAYGLLAPLQRYSSQAISHHILYDKKKAYGKVSFILLEAIGKVCIRNDITSDEIEEAILYVEKTCQ